MTSIKTKAMIVALILAAAPMAMAAGEQGSESVSVKLTPKLRSLLQQEMRQVLAAQQAMLASLVTGDHASLATQARQVHDSFILKQSLTPQDRQDLQQAVPLRFVELDRRFHQLALQLSQAAEQSDVQQEVETFNAMSRACVECHSRFVTDRFPDLE